MSSLTTINSFLQARIHERQSRHCIQKLQEKKLTRLLHYAYTHSPFYHTLYADHGITDQTIRSTPLHHLPSVDKQMIMDHFDDVLTTKDCTKQHLLQFLETTPAPTALFQNRYHVVHTSGSTGDLGIFITTKREWDYFFPYITRVFPFHFTKQKSVFFGAIDGHYLGASFSSWLNIGLSRFFTKSLLLDITKPLQQQIHQLNAYQPQILGGYFTGLKILADQQQQGTLHIQPEVIVNCGECVIPQDQQIIQEVFQAPLMNLYGLAECPILGVGKPDYDGIYLMDDLAIVETDGQHCYLTNLYNYTQPLIRYQLTDMITKTDRHATHLPFSIVESIIGRTEQLLWLHTATGEREFIHPIVIVEFYVKGVTKHQIRKTSDTSFDFYAVLSTSEVSNTKHKISEKLTKILQEKHLDNVSFTIHLVDDLPINTTTGKFQLIIDETA